MAIYRKAVFLDRDGTINEDPGYVNHPDQLKLIEGVGKALASLQSGGFALVVVSNQSGVARGIIQPEVLPLIHARLEELLRPWGVRIDHYSLCVHHPDSGCACRKPRPTLLLEGARALGSEMAESFMVGDKESDLLAGRAAGCRGVALVRTGEGRTTEAALSRGGADFIGDSLVDVAEWILSQGSANS